MSIERVRTLLAAGLRRDAEELARLLDPVPIPEGERSEMWRLIASDRTPQKRGTPNHKGDRLATLSDDLKIAEAVKALRDSGATLENAYAEVAQRICKSEETAKRLYRTFYPKSR
ncbi:hypothetical protein [uncultured Luteimonas sp.]|uniref:hypothetical protein n=1 Tax=uncultured Luteimonas sp. TaxID=453144 RepID=UPI002620A3E6|nr:hypothetical protein [uncultured Luteimonas sp.]